MLDVFMYSRCCKDLREWGVEDRDCSMVLYGMCAANVSYQESLGIYAEYRGWAAEIIHGRICYALLAAHVDVRPGTLFDFLKWKGEQENENGISS